MTQTGRDLRIDFFRGLALVFIFWDHIPGNPLAQVTPRNIGLSDAAEIFVFLAGYAAVLAYGKLLQRDGYLVACLRILRRVWVLYVAHIFLLAVLMGIVFFTNNHVEQKDFVGAMGLDYFLSHPQQAVTDELLLRFKPNLMDPLPLYIVLLGALPVCLPLLLRWPVALLGGSCLLYLLAPLPDMNLAGPQGGEWFFNPLAWQFLFFLGGAAALYSQRRPADAPRPTPTGPLFIASALYLAASAALALSWKFQLPDDWMPKLMSDLIYPIDKTDLSPPRLLHFLALAYCIAVILPRGDWLQRWPAREMCRMGQYSLEVFCLGVLLAPLADAANNLLDEHWLVRLATAMAGLALMMALALWLDFIKHFGQRRTQPAPRDPPPQLLHGAR
ncbi:OpgC family protein [Pseudomonas sp. Gutcm_11s]|uniref:OpgC family protein n=1 Tax=Pseudomonas sp. Gutcm_11s TaxID=3026088 RepID=UPI00235F347A|nr:OpgC domain-containing protein [Pseudomonas sp. Gutcm_11s]MDD0842856.1 OpgC domain-containing protein [Pseudomonas sp. Gutcm_11s]